MPFTAALPSPPSSWASFHVGPLTVHTYALCILAGIIAAILITQRRLKARRVAPGFLIDVAIWALPLGVIAARIYHVLTHTGDYFAPGDDLWNVFAIWDGGNAIYGSMLGGALGIWIATRRAGVRFLSFADAMAPGMLVAQAIGRLGNYFNHELFGSRRPCRGGCRSARPTRTSRPACARARSQRHRRPPSRSGSARPDEQRSATRWNETDLGRALAATADGRPVGIVGRRPRVVEDRFPQCAGGVVQVVGGRRRAPTQTSVLAGVLGPGTGVTGVEHVTVAGERIRLIREAVEVLLTSSWRILLDPRRDGVTFPPTGRGGRRQAPSRTPKG